MTMPNELSANIDVKIELSANIDVQIYDSHERRSVSLRRGVATADIRPGYFGAVTVRVENQGSWGEVTIRAEDFERIAAIYAMTKAQQV
jgi:hypothetical protein